MHIKIVPKNLSVEKSTVSYENRIKKNGHKGLVLWFTGLSGSGKSTISKIVEQELFNENKQVIVLDGDNVRAGLNKDLGFDSKSRSENIRRISEVANLFANAGFIVICSFISPYKKDRIFARSVMPKLFHEIYIKSSLENCIKRDSKNLYQKAKEGKIKNFTGIDDVYEEPENADLVVDTECKNVDSSVGEVLRFVEGLI